MSAADTVETALALSTQQVLFAGHAIEIRTNSPQVARCAQQYFNPIQHVESNPTASRASITIHVRDTDELCDNAPFFRARGHFALARFTRGDSFWLNLRTREIVGECSAELADDSRRWRAHIFPALLGILSAAIDVAPVHAACLVREGRGILLAGHSGAGKSTLTIAMARRGYALLADDWTYLSATEDSGARADVQAWGLPVPVKLLPDADAFFGELLAFRTDCSLNGEIAYEVWPEECFGISRSLRSAVSSVVLLERASKQGCSMIPIARGKAVAHLQAEIEPLEGTLAECYKRQLDLIQHAVEGAPCYRFSFNDHPDRVAETLDRALASVS